MATKAKSGAVIAGQGKPDFVTEFGFIYFDLTSGIIYRQQRAPVGAEWVRFGTFDSLTSGDILQIFIDPEAVFDVEGTGTAGTPAGGVLTVQGDPSMTPLEVNAIVTPSGTVDVNLLAVAGAATSVNTGVSDNGTQRVVIATDQPTIDVNVISSAVPTQYTEDDPSTGGEQLTLAGAIRNDSAVTVLTDFNGDYSPISVDSVGRIFVSPESSIVIDTTTSNLAQETGGNLAGANANLSVIQATLSATYHTEDSAASSGDGGISILGVRNDSATTKTTTDGDYSNIATDAAGRVGIADLGGSITVDNSGTFAVQADTELPAAETPSDNLTNATPAPRVNSLGYVFDGSTWDRAKGDSTDGTLVNLGTNNDVTITSGNITADTELPAAAALGDNESNSTAVPSVAGRNMVYDGSTWDRMRGDSTDGTLVNLGVNNDVTVTSGSITADTELPAATTLTDNFANPTAPAVGSFNMVWDGATWDRLLGDSTNGVVTQESVSSTISTNNSSTSTLGANLVFTGTADTGTNYSSVTIMVYTDVDSATDGLSIQQSSDSTNWDVTDTYTIKGTITGGVGKTFGVQVTARYLRVVYTNGTIAQGTFRLQTILHKYQQRTSTVRPQDSRSNENDVTEVVSYLSGYNTSSSSWDRLRSTQNYGLQVDVKQLAGDDIQRRIQEELLERTRMENLITAQTNERYGSRDSYEYR